MNEKLKLIGDGNRGFYAPDDFTWRAKSLQTERTEQPPKKDSPIKRTHLAPKKQTVKTAFNVRAL